MPFTPPSTYTSKANTGYYAVFFLGTVASPLSYNAMLEVKSIKADYFTVPEVPTTHLQSPNYTEEFFPGMLKPGTIDLSGNFIGDTSQMPTGLAAAQDIIFWKITSPVQQNSKTYTATGTGFITNYSPGPFENNKALEFSIKLQITGQVTETVA